MQKEGTSDYREVARFTVSDRWDLVRKHKEDIGNMLKVAREMDRYIFSGLEYSKRARYECSIYHEGRTMELLKIVRSMSVLFILIFIPAQ